MFEFFIGVMIMSIFATTGLITFGDDLGKPVIYILMGPAMWILLVVASVYRLICHVDDEDD